MTRDGRRYMRRLSGITEDMHMTSPWSEGHKAEDESRKARNEMAARVATMLSDSGLAAWEVIAVLSMLLSSLVVSYAKTPSDLAVCRETVLDMLREHMTPVKK